MLDYRHYWEALDACYDCYIARVERAKTFSERQVFLCHSPKTSEYSFFFQKYMYSAQVRHEFIGLGFLFAHYRFFEG